MDIKTPKVSEVKDIQGWQRVSTHSHVRGLGLDDNAEASGVSIRTEEEMTGEEIARTMSMMPLWNR